MSGADNRLRVPLAEVFAAAPTSWRAVTDAFAASAGGQSLAAFVDGRRAAGSTVFPARPLRALELTPLEAVRVVVLGQDPYHGAGQAQGLAFSVPDGTRLPPSLRNIFHEVQRDTGAASRCVAGSLEPWAGQGVLLLNSALTVEEGLPQSHAGRGWEALTDALFTAVAGRAEPVVFLLWGASAQRKRDLVDGRRHAVLTANHPSPLSARRPPEPFIGCGHFSRANAFLEAKHPHARPIAW